MEPPDVPNATTSSPIAEVADVDGVTGFISRSEHHATFSVENAHLAAVMTRLASLGIEAIESQPPTLEELFMRHYAGEPEGAPGR